MPIPEDSALSQWGKFFVEGGKIIGRPFTVLDDGLQRKGMEAAGFVDIQEFDYKVPSSSPLAGSNFVSRLLTIFPVRP